jgi:23S rRNA (pseudouridine1915-N3)-methyltransferase
MKLVVISATKVKDRAILALEAEYLKRLRVCKVTELSGSTVASTDLKKAEMEGEGLLKAAAKYDRIIALDESGQNLNSKDFSKLIEKWTVQGQSSFAFLIGGAYGLSQEVRAKSDFVWSLSALTFPFQLARLLTIEQLYRAFCNLNGHPYHKE